jgi:UDP-N-acetylglucosamine diphosphorylase/glucosamine-1-phosphate N-acetyltransferase
MKAVILAAGEGARMGPFTASVPKVMIPVGNRPIVEYVVRALVESGIREILMVIGYRRERIQAYFGDGKAFDARITYLPEPKQLGTAHTVRQAKPNLEGHFLVLNGSSLIDKQFVADLLDHADGPAVSIKESERPQEYGVVTLRGRNVLAITERPREVTSNLISTGAYILEPSVFDLIDRQAQEGRHDLPRVLSEWARTTAITAVESKGTWVDARYPWDLLRLNATALQSVHDIRAGTIERSVVIHGRVAIGEGCTIRAGAFLQGPLSLGSGCEVGANAVLLPSTSLGKNVRVGPLTTIANSILMDDVNLGPSSVVQDSVLGSGVAARAGLLAASGPADVAIEGEYHTVRQIGALIGEDSELGNGVSVDCGTVINERTRVASGARLRGTIPAGAVVL